MRPVAGKAMVFIGNEDLKDKSMQHLLTLIKILFLALLISACSKRTVDLEAMSHNIKMNTSLDSSSRVKVQTSSISNAYQFSDEQSDYQVTIKPKGLFKFNAEKGVFEGEADSIMIKGKSKKTTAAGQKSNDKKDSTAVTDLKKKAAFQEKDDSKKKKTEANSFLITIIILLIVAGLVWVACKIYIRINS